MVRVPELSAPTAVANERIREAFFSVTVGYNLILWPLCLSLVAIIVLRSLRAVRMEQRPTENEERNQQCVLVGLPIHMLQIAALGWFPRILVFPFSLWLMEGVDLVVSFTHFGLNFITCALLVMIYSYLGMSWLVASVGWLQHWMFPCRFASIAVTRELGHFSKGLQLARLAAMVVPFGQLRPAGPVHAEGESETVRPVPIAADLAHRPWDVWVAGRDT